ncbi:alpha-aminoadipic semialdehyde synthase-like [Papaver somniferum]|uniref:alpha-aminoadipic semialdehyde synthase-like n=1 Tax=Papaver somniferum TaxID=3469 RepID=UPI000E6F65C1|nr:alpha-aminoadipic semialdehyde synthase-like [Papaver somniferum]
MVEPKDPTRTFDKADYYAHAEHYNPIFHEKIAPYASVIVNCMYWEKRFPRLLSIKQLQELTKNGCPLIGVADITCDIGGSIEFVNQTTQIETPFFRYDPLSDSYHDDMEGKGVICLAVDILPTEFAKEASKHFGDILSQFVGNLASTKNLSELPSPLKRACIAHGGALTSLYEYIPRMRKSDLDDSSESIANGKLAKKKHNIRVSLSGHLFDKFLINEALDIIEAAGGSFHLAKCDVGQSSFAMSFSELEVGVDDRTVLDQIIDSLNSLASANEDSGDFDKNENKFSMKFGKVSESVAEKGEDLEDRPVVLILGAGRVCRPAAEFLAAAGSISCLGNDDTDEPKDVQVILASLYLKDAQETIEGIKNATAVQLDITDQESLCKYISQVDVVISLLPPSCHITIAKACIELKKNLVTASYVDDSMSKLNEEARISGITILGEMGLDPGIDHMMAMKMINQAHARKGIIKSFTSYCGGLPSPEAANNPLGYKFSWNPAGAIKAGRNPATYKYCGETMYVDGDKLYDSATRFRIPNLPAFALECLPNRNSLVYGDFYGIGDEASTIFRGTLRYEGTIGEIMACLAKIGFFNTEPHPAPKEGKTVTFGTFLDELIKVNCDDTVETVRYGNEIVERLITLGACKERACAAKTAKTIRFLGLHEQTEIPVSCKSAFDITCLRMEERLAYVDTEQDMVLLHHEVEIEFPDGRPTEKHQTSLLEFGKIKNGKTTTAMAVTVGIPAAIGALLLLQNKIKTKGVLRPLEPEVYMPALDILEAYGFKLSEKME